eukprot:5173055-Pyramimonas_sp.AAC.1
MPPLPPPPSSRLARCSAGSSRRRPTRQSLCPRRCCAGPEGAARTPRMLPSIVLCPSALAGLPVPPRSCWSPPPSRPRGPPQRLATGFGLSAGFGFAPRMPCRSREPCRLCPPRCSSRWARGAPRAPLAAPRSPRRCLPRPPARTLRGSPL